MNMDTGTVFAAVLLCLSVIFIYIMFCSGKSEARFKQKEKFYRGHHVPRYFLFTGKMLFPEEDEIYSGIKITVL